MRGFTGALGNQMNGNFPFDHFLKTDSKPAGPPPEPFQPSFELPLGNNESKKDIYHKEKEATDELLLTDLPAIEAKILSLLKCLINQEKYNAFFSATFKLKSLENKHLHFVVTTQFIKIMIENHYMSHLREAVEMTLDHDHSFKVEVSSDDIEVGSNNNSILNSIKSDTFQEQPPSAPQIVNTNTKAQSVKEARFSIDLMPSKNDLMNQIDSKVINHLKEEHYGFQVDPKKTFDNFVVGSSNNMAFASSIAVGKNPGKVYPSLYLHSNSGLGKTHLLHSVGNYIKQNNPTLTICLITARDFMTEMINAMANKKTHEFRKKYSELVDVLMVDDIHELKNKPGTQNEFFHVFNELHQKGKQLIFTSDKSPKEIDGLEERLKTRLSWGLVLDIQSPDFETRVAILKKKALEEDIFLPEDVVTLIANSITSNIRELEGALIRLAAYASVFGVDIDLEIAKEQLHLKDLGTTPTNTLDSIAKSVSKHFEIPVADLRSKSRNKEITLARHIAMHLSYEIIAATLSEIGAFYGNRDHSSVLHGIDKIKKQMSSSPQISQMVFNLQQQLES